MVESAEADVEGPAVATQDPDALADQRVGDGEQVAGVRRVVGGEALAKSKNTLPLLSDFCFGLLGGVEQFGNQLNADFRCQARYQ